MTIRHAAVPALALSAVLALAGCSDGEGEAQSQAPIPQRSSESSSMSQDSTPDESASEESGDGAASDLPEGVNEADVMFAMKMIPHHQQAIELSEMLLAKENVDSRARRLAEDIKAAQGPEIEKLQKWLEEWGVAAEEQSGAMGHGMDGMMTEEDMAALEEASGPEATVLFLEQMIVHHEGAVEMAKTEAENGSGPKAIALAQSIIDAQKTEIQEMKDLLQTL